MMDRGRGTALAVNGIDSASTRRHFAARAKTSVSSASEQLEAAESQAAAAAEEQSLADMINRYEQDSLELMRPRPSDVDDESWLKSVEELQAQLELQYEEIIKETNEIMATSEWKEYRRVCDETVEKLQDQFVKDPAPVSAHSVAEFHRKVDEAVSSLQAFYRNKLAARFELEALEREKHLQLSDREREERIDAMAAAAVEAENEFDGNGRVRAPPPEKCHWTDLLTGEKLKRMRKDRIEENLVRHRKGVERRLLGGETVMQVRAAYPWLPAKRILSIRAELSQQYPDVIKTRAKKTSAKKQPAGGAETAAETVQPPQR
jgi:hypothetical protein